MGVLDKLNAASPRTVTEEICLDAALEHEWDLLQRSLPDAAKADDDAAALEEEGASLADPMPQTRARVDAMEELRGRMAASVVTFVFGGMPWTERLELQASHPPRKGHLVDSLRGWNIETFTRALIQRCCREVTDADGDTLTEIPDEVWDDLLGREARPATDDERAREAKPPKLNYQQVNRLFVAAFKTTDGEAQVPPTARSLLVSQDSGASLAQPGPGTSPRNGSAGGSRRTSPRSSATSKAGSSGS